MSTAQPRTNQLRPDVSSGEVKDENDPIQGFLAYSAEYWPTHFRNSDINIRDALMCKIWQLYETDRHVYNLWFPIFWRKRKLEYTGRTPRVGKIELLAILGHAQVLQSIWQVRGMPMK